MSRQLATSCENLVASTQFLVALATSESQFRALCYGILSQIILKTLVVLSNFIERCNLIPNLGNSDLFVHENYKSTFFTFKSDYPFDVFYVG